MLSNLHANFSFVRRRMPHEECFILGFFKKNSTFNHWVAWLKLFSLFSVGRRATVNMEQSAQENKSIIMTITIVRGSLWWKTCWNKIVFKSNLQGLSFVMVLEAYIWCVLLLC